MNKLTPQQEIYARLIVEGKSQHQAYLEAYPKSNGWLASSVDCEASKLASNTKVIQRINELRSQLDIKSIETVEKLICELNQVLSISFETKQIAPAVSAIMGKAKLLGLVVDKVETKNLTSLTEENLLKARERVAKMKQDNEQPALN